MTDDFRLMIRRVVRHLRPRPPGLPKKWEPQVSDFNATKRSFDFGADRKCTVTDPAYWPDPAPTDITSLTQHVREFFDGDFRREYTICCAVPDASRRRLLTEAQRYLRNVRHAIEEWIPNRSQRPVFDDAPADIHAAEKELLKVAECLDEIANGQKGKSAIVGDVASKQLEVPQTWKRITCQRLRMALEIDQKTLVKKLRAQEIGNRKISSQAYWINPDDLALTTGELAELFKTGIKHGEK